MAPAKDNYFVYGPVRLDDGRRAVFIGAGYHWGCCQDGEVLLADGQLELVNPDTIHAISGAPQCFDASWYDFQGYRKPVKGWQRYASLKAAYEEYNARGYEANGARHVALRAHLPQHENGLGPHYPWPYRVPA